MLHLSCICTDGMDTGDLVARTLLLARDRLLPEFTYLDPQLTEISSELASSMSIVLHLRETYHRILNSVDHSNYGRSKYFYTK
mgnify:CR=1 FL=1